MGKIKPIAERVEWTSDPATKTCRGTFVRGVGRDFLLKEILSAPVEKSSLETRTARMHGYADEKLIIETVLDLDEDFLRKLPYRFVKRDLVKDEVFNYEFLVEEPSDQEID